MEKELSEMTRDELNALAKERGVKVTKNMKDETVISKLEAAAEEAAAAENPDANRNPDPLKLNNAVDVENPTEAEDAALADRTAMERGDVSKVDDAEKSIADARAANPASEVNEDEEDEAEDVEPLMVKYIGAAPTTKINGVEFKLNLASEIPAHKRDWFEAKADGNPSLEIVEG